MQTTNRLIKMETAVSLGVMTSILTAAVWLNSQLSTIKAELTLIRMEVQAKLQQMDTRVGDRWTGTHMHFFASELRLKNTNIFVPDTERIRSMYPVTKDPPQYQP